MTSMTLITREFSHHFLCSQKTPLWLVYRNISVHVIAPCFENVPNEKNNVSQIHCGQNRRHKSFRIETIANEDSLALVFMDAKFTLWAQQFHPIYRFQHVSPIISASTRTVWGVTCSFSFKWKTPSLVSFKVLFQKHIPVSMNLSLPFFPNSSCLSPLILTTGINCMDLFPRYFAQTELLVKTQKLYSILHKMRMLT